MKVTKILANSIKAVQPKKIDISIEIVGSTNPRLNAMAKDSRITILEVLRKKYKRVNISIVNNMKDLDALVAKKPDLVVLGMKLVLLDPECGFDESRKIWLADYLRKKGIAYTGSNSEALSLEFEKQEAKQVTVKTGLNSSRYFIKDSCKQY